MDDSLGQYKLPKLTIKERNLNKYLEELKMLSKTYIIVTKTIPSPTARPSEPNLQ